MNTKRPSHLSNYNVQCFSAGRPLPIGFAISVVLSTYVSVVDGCLLWLYPPYLGSLLFIVQYLFMNPRCHDEGHEDSNLAPPINN